MHSIINDHFSTKYHSVFIAKDKINDFCQDLFSREVDIAKLRHIINLGLLPIYEFQEQKMVIKNDVVSLLDSFCVPEDKNVPRPQGSKLFEQNTIEIDSYTTIDIEHEDSSIDPTFFSAIRNLIAIHKSLVRREDKTELNMSYFLPGARLNTLSAKVFDFANIQLSREKEVDVNTVSQFARSAYYMGSKRLLCGFLIEGISSVLPESGIVVDLMCGSGVASGAFCKKWRTISSDALQFCRILSVVHGGGFDQQKAKDLLFRLLPNFKQHFNDLQSMITDGIQREENLFCRNTDTSLLQDYKEFVRNFPTLSKTNDNSTIRWDPALEVNRRKENPSLYPYCLFTAYFSNVYLGLRQSVEVDSLRYSISKLQDENEKNWALGALIATVSALGTTYGGHFAQPLVSNEDDINIKNVSSIIDIENISSIIEKRSLSITHEFSVRLLNLAEQSQNSQRSIEIVPGPWQEALSILDDRLGSSPVLVYLDAPYKREEYSRYYHVLETLVSYSYPSCMGIGLTPTPRERFTSKFFTKVESQIVEVLVNIITSILQRGWICAWSYSDSGKANMYQVISAINQNIACDIKSYAAPFVHKSQGKGRRPKKIKEYLIIFSSLK